MKKCKGCGEILQYTDKYKLGYAPNESFDYCQKCFRLTHYGDINGLKKSIDENENILNTITNIHDALLVYIVDCFDALYLNTDKIIKRFSNREILLIINKIDLLPRNINDEKIDNIYSSIFKPFTKTNNIQCVLTYKNDLTFKNMFFDILNESNYKKAILFGRANVGKSSLINKLISDNYLTTSIYPGTTSNFNEIKYNSYTLIDTPGLIDEDSFVTYIDNKLMKRILPLKTIKAQNFQVYSRQSYFIEGLIEIDINPSDNVTVSFMINNNLEVHRTKTENATKYLENNEKSFKLKLLPLKDNQFEVKKINTFYIKGLGLFKIKGNCKINVKVNDKINVYVNEVNL